MYTLEPVTCCYSASEITSTGWETRGWSVTSCIGTREARNMKHHHNNRNHHRKWKDKLIITICYPATSVPAFKHNLDQTGVMAEPIWGRGVTRQIVLSGLAANTRNGFSCVVHVIKYHDKTILSSNDFAQRRLQKLITSSTNLIVLQHGSCPIRMNHMIANNKKQQDTCVFDYALTANYCASKWHSTSSESVTSSNLTLLWMCSSALFLKSERDSFIDAKTMIVGLCF